MAGKKKRKTRNANRTPNAARKELPYKRQQYKYELAVKEGTQRAMGFWGGQLVNRILQKRHPLKDQNGALTRALRAWLYDEIRFAGDPPTMDELIQVVDDYAENYGVGEDWRA